MLTIPFPSTATAHAALFRVRLHSTGQFLSTRKPWFMRIHPRLISRLVRLRHFSAFWSTCLLLLTLSMTASATPQIAPGGSGSFPPTAFQGPPGAWGIYNPAGTLIAASGPPTPGTNGWSVSFQTAYNGSPYITALTVNAPSSAALGTGYKVVVGGPPGNDAASFDITGGAGGDGSVGLSSLTLLPTSVIGAQTNGTMSTGTITLRTTATTDTVVSLSSSNTSLVTLPSTVTVPAGSTSQTFTLTANNVTSQATVQISALYGGMTLTQTLTINPWLNALSLSSSRVVGGSPVTGTITLNAPAPSGGLPVTITASDPSVTVSSGGTVTVPAGSNTQTFTLATSTVTAGTSVTIAATYSSLTLTQSLYVQPLLSYLSLSPSTVTGGSPSTGTITLNGPAPTAVSISLSSGNTAVATVPASVAVAAGATSAQFPVTTSVVTSVSSAAITASYAGASASQTLTVNPIQVSVSLSPTSVVGGNPSTGTVTLSGQAPANGLTVTLSSSNTTVATVPGNVIVAAGQTSATFTVTTTAVTSSTSVYITAAYGGLSNYAYLTVQPLLGSVSISPYSVIGGSSATGTVNLNGPAPSGGTTVTLSSSSPAASVPASVTVAAGATTQTFTVTTTTVTQNTYVNISASNAGTTVSAGLYLQPLLANLWLNPSSVYGGGTSVGTVTLNAAAPAGGITITLASSNTAVATVPASIPVAAGATSATFNITTSAVSVSSSSTISAAYGGVTLQQTLSVVPLLASVSLSPNRVIGGGSAIGTVNLSGPAPSGGITVTLASDNTAVATVPVSVAVAAGATSVPFPVTVQTVTVSSTANISAAYGGVTRSAQLTVVPLIASVSLNPSKVVGGDPSTGTVSFNIQAPSGVTLTLSSSNPVVTVPSSLSVATSSYSATFNVTTTAVTTETVVTITAFYGGVSQSAILTLEPMPTIIGLSFIPAEVTGGSGTTCKVTLSGIAPVAGSVVALSNPNTAIATVPFSVTVSSGQTSTTFPVTTTPVGSTTSVSMTGTYRSTSASAALTVDRPTLTGFAFAQNPTVGGNTDLATLRLDGNAPAGGFIVQLSCTPTNGAAVSGAALPTSVTIPAGSSSTTVPVQTTTVNAPVTLTFTAQAVQAGTTPITGGETLTASVGLTLSTLHAIDLLLPKAIQLQWSVSAVGNFLLYRGGVLVATLPNTATVYTDAFGWTSGQTYEYDIKDGNTSPPTLLSSEQVVPYLVPATQAQAVDSRLDPRYSTNVFLDHAFGSTAYKGGLFVGFASDPARIGRSFAQFNLTQQPTGGVYRAGRVNAYFVTGYTDSGPVSMTVGCQAIPNNAWSAPTLTWDTAPTVAGFSPSAATQTTAIQYDPSLPGGLSVTGGSGQAALSWVAPVTRKTISSYTVWYGSSDGYYPNSVPGLTGRSTTITGLTNGTPYYFAVQAVYSDGTSSGNSPSASATPPNVSGTRTPPNVWCSWLLSNDIQGALLGNGGGGNLLSVAWASTNESQSGWAYFAKIEYDSTLGPNVTHLWSIPTLVRLDAPPTVSASGSGTGLLTVNGIGLQGSATVQLSSDNPAVATVPASIPVSGLNRSFIITPHGAGMAHITATLGAISITKTVTVGP